MQRLAERTAARIERVLRRAGRYLDEHDAHDEDADALALEQPALSACYQAAAGDRQLFGDNAGKPPLRHTPSGVTKRVIHASAAVPGKDRARLERLCRYAARPPLAQRAS